MVKTHMIRLRVIEGTSACDQSAFCAYFHTFLVEVQMNAVATYMWHKCNDCWPGGGGGPTYETGGDAHHFAYM